MEVKKIDELKNEPYTGLLYCPPGVGKSTAIGLIAEGSDGKVLDTALVAIKSPETRRYGAVELRDGKQLLDYEWENITAAYGRLYAYKDGVCHVFAY